MVIDIIIIEISVIYVVQLFWVFSILSSKYEISMFNTKREFLIMWLIPYYWLFYHLYKHIKNFIKEYKKLD